MRVCPYNAGPLLVTQTAMATPIISGAKSKSAAPLEKMSKPRLNFPPKGELIDRFRDGFPENEMSSAVDTILCFIEKPQFEPGQSIRKL